jgi:diketogulonate reductase-like aldo/keto reductase
MLAHCRSKGLIFMAYCPLARGGIFNDPVLGEIAKARGRTIAQIALRWLIQQDIVAPIPRSGDAKHMRESLEVFDFTLSADEMQRIHALKRPDGRIANPAGRAPAWD